LRGEVIPQGNLRTVCLATAQTLPDIHCLTWATAAARTQVYINYCNKVEEKWRQLPNSFSCVIEKPRQRMKIAHSRRDHNGRHCGARPSSLLIIG
jgi:hypothetical protein